MTPQQANILLKKRGLPTVPVKKETKSKAKTALRDYINAWAWDKGFTTYSEYRFAKPRRWRFDWAIPEIMVAVEYEGGIFDRNGSHTSVKDITRDVEKYNAAAIAGWKVLRYTAKNYKKIQQDLLLL